EEERPEEHGLAADAVAVVAENGPAQGARHEADGVGAVGAELARQRIERRKEKLVEHESGGEPVEKEVVPLDRRADQECKDDLADRSLSRHAFSARNIFRDTAPRREISYTVSR